LLLGLFGFALLGSGRLGRGFDPCPNTSILALSTVCAKDSVQEIGAVCIHQQIERSVSK